MIHGPMLTQGKQPLSIEMLTHSYRPRWHPVGMEIGHRIQQARAAAGLTQTELAKAVGVSRGLVGQWENHTKKPGRDVLQRVAAVTSVSIRFLLGDERIEDGGLVISDPDEAALIRRYRLLTDRQKRGIHDLVGLTATLPE